MKNIAQVIAILIVLTPATGVHCAEVGASLGQWELRQWQRWIKEPDSKVSVEFILSSYVQGYVDAWIGAEAEIAEATDTTTELAAAISACSQRSVFSPESIVTTVKDVSLMLDWTFIGWFDGYALARCTELRSVFTAQYNAGFIRSTTG